MMVLLRGSCCLVPLVVGLVESVLVSTYSDYYIMMCNSSVYEVPASHSQTPILIESPVLSQELIGQPFYCQYELVAPPNYHAEVEVIKVVTGRASYNFTAKSCGRRNYLRIWDGFEEHAWRPTELCGSYLEGQIMVTRIVSGQQVMVEFRTQEFTELTSYQVRVYFKPNPFSHETLGYNFGNYFDVAGRVDGLCEWEIEVNTCLGYCKLVSPGYPGIYPPHTTCTYKLINRDGERVELFLAGSTRHEGKFDIKRSDRCEEDRVTVYDGPTNRHPIIGVFCSHYAPEIISSGDTLFMEFVAQAGRPPWDYSGFDSRVTHRWKKHFDTGMPIPNTPCSWEFNSTIDKAGQINTPDYKIEGKLECEYKFYGKPGEYVEFEIAFTELQPNREFLYIFDGSSLVERIWSEDDTASKRDVLVLNSTTIHPVILYQLTKGQISNHIPIFIYYTFRSIEAESSSAEPDRIQQVLDDSDSGSSISRAVISISSLLVIALTVPYFTLNQC